MPDSENMWGPWIEWSGGECPLDLGQSGVFKVKHRSGRISPSIRISRADKFFWQHRDYPSDIIAYRVRKP